MLSRCSTVVLLVGLATGCLEIEQRITLKRDKSGTSKMRFKADMEPSVYMIAYMQKAMMGGQPNPELNDSDLSAARKMLLEQQKQNDAKPTRQNVEKQLPEGVKLLKFKAKEKGTQVDVDALFAFDHVRRLGEVKVGEDSVSVAGAGGKSPVSSIVYTEQADSFTLRTVFENPMAAPAAPGMEDGPENLPGKIGKVMKAAVSKLGFTMVIDSPFKVLEHNATSQRGTVLTWKYDYESLKKLGQKAQIQVKYAK